MKAYGGSGSGEHERGSQSGGVAPGKRTRTEAIQRRRAERAERDAAPPTTGGSGARLPAPVQAKMEDAFDFDFGAVRVHEGSQAADMGALAYTQGSDVHFAPGQYDPGSARGQELIGHELAHVVQQSEGRVAATTQLKGVGLNDDSSLEREADDWGAAAARGESVGRGGSASAAAPASGAPVQRFTDYTKAGAKDAKDNVHWAGNKLRVADDGTAAVAQASIAGSQEMYVLASRLPSINADLKAANAPLKLIKAGGSVSGAPPVNLDEPAQVLDRVKPVEATDASKDKEIPDDCGNAARTVTGTFAERKSLHAEYDDKAGKHATTKHTDPEMMKYEIMVDHFGDKMPRVKTILTDVQQAIATASGLAKKIEPHIPDWNAFWKDLDDATKAAQAIRSEFDAAKAAHELEVKTIEDAGAADKDEQIKAAEAAWAAAKAKLQARFDAAKKIYDEADKKWKAFLDKDTGGGKKIRDIFKEYFDAAKVKDDLIKEIMGPYEAMTGPEQEAFDQKVGINRHANPGVGEAYTISSGGPPKSNRSTWNFHWGGVIFKSTTGSDNITMENYAGNATDEWYFQMYGVPTAGKDRTGQTFHEQHRDVHAQHGTTPTTLSTEKQ